VSQEILDECDSFEGFSPGKQIKENLIQYVRYERQGKCLSLQVWDKF
jgi:hypothetical protein